MVGLRLMGGNLAFGEHVISPVGPVKFRGICPSILREVGKKKVMFR
jgi:hypothetical protein